MKETELRSCPLCGGKVEIKDYTDRIYGFNDYMIKCACGLRFHSQATCEHYFVGNTYHTPQTERAKKKAYDKMIEDWNRRADSLLENGVIVPPCKVGDTVYIVDGTTDGIVVGKITNFEFNIYKTPREWITVRGNYPLFGELEEKNRIDLLIGKTVFLSLEEAEKALAEREGK